MLATESSVPDESTKLTVSGEEYSYRPFKAYLDLFLLKQTIEEMMTINKISAIKRTIRTPPTAPPATAATGTPELGTARVVSTEDAATVLEDTVVTAMLEDTVAVLEDTLAVLEGTVAASEDTLAVLEGTVAASEDTITVFKAVLLVVPILLANDSIKLDVNSLGLDS
jgi:hypothetical protein